MRQVAKILVLVGSVLVAPEIAAFTASAQAVGTKPTQPVQTQPAPAPKSGTPATVVDDREAGGILGKNVRSSVGEDMGNIVDVIVGRSGQVRAAIIDFGGFLGVGSRKIAVAWDALRFPAAGQLDPVTVELTRDQVRLAPEYLPGEPIVVLGSAGPQPADLPVQKKKK